MLYDSHIFDESKANSDNTTKREKYLKVEVIHKLWAADQTLTREAVLIQVRQSSGASQRLTSRMTKNCTENKSTSPQSPRPTSPSSHPTSPHLHPTQPHLIQPHPTSTHLNFTHSLPRWPDFATTTSRILRSWPPHEYYHQQSPRLWPLQQPTLPPPGYAGW